MYVSMYMSHGDNLLKRMYRSKSHLVQQISTINIELSTNCIDNNVCSTEHFGISCNK